MTHRKEGNVSKSESNHARTELIPRPVVRGRVVELEAVLERLSRIAGVAALMLNIPPPGVSWELHAAIEAAREILSHDVRTAHRR